MKRKRSRDPAVVMTDNAEVQTFEESTNIRSRSWFIRDSTIARRHVWISFAWKTLRKPLIFRWVCQRTKPRLSKEGKTITWTIDTKRSEINSNDYGSCWNCLVEFESNFFAAGINTFWAIRLFRVWGSCAVCCGLFSHEDRHIARTQHCTDTHSTVIV